MSEYPHSGTSFLSIKKRKLLWSREEEKQNKAKQNQIISGIYTFNKFIANWYYTMKRNSRNPEWQM